ncbi:MAG: YncE family protein, partial [Candidatus Limnocylindria bacterium]
MTTLRRRAAAAIALVLAASIAGSGAASVPAPNGGSHPAAKDRNLREVLLVGNNWEGTADVTKPRGKFRRIARINIIPDIQERMAEIATDPERLGYFLAIRELVGEGNDQYVDDMYTSNDGRLLIVSRPSLRDVVALDLASGELVWRFVVDGQRSDHMAISPDGTHVAVSASTG